MKRDIIYEFTGVLFGLCIFVILIVLFVPKYNKITTQPTPPDTAELWRVVDSLSNIVDSAVTQVDSIVRQTPWDRLEWEQRILRKAREGK